MTKITQTEDTITIKKQVSEDLKNSIMLNANQMINLNGKVDNDLIINDALKSLSDETTKKRDFKHFKDIKEFKEYAQKSSMDIINEYIKYLQKTYDEDISNISIIELKNKTAEFNLKFLNTYIVDIKQQAPDLIATQEDYASKLASTTADLQLFEINKIGLDAFLKADLKKDKSFKQIMQLDALIKAQKEIKNEFLEYEDAPKDVSDAIVKTILYTNQILDSYFQVENIIKNNNNYYKKLHQKHNKINKLIAEIGNKFKQRDDELNSRKAELEIIDNTNTDLVVKRGNIKLPKTYEIDFDIMKMFNNTYTNYQYKSVDDNRHKEIDTKAKLILNLDVDTEDAITNIKNAYLSNFIKNDNQITLYPIQNAIINGFINVRDKQDTIDKVIPLESVLKYITQNSKLRLPTNKKDLQLYEDFMKFFDKCKIQVKITNRKTKETIFEIKQPISLLTNYEAKENGKYGYVIGNSVLYLIKNKLDEIYDIPHKTTIATDKGYLYTKKLPTSIPTINVVQTIYPKIAQMINSYKTKNTYNGKINITSLYNFQALYNKRDIPTKDDKNTAREILNKYLDSLIDKGLIISYTPIKEGKEINQYKIEINKDAKL